MKRGRAGVAYKHINTCCWCGGGFYSHRIDAKFCKPKCRTAHCRFMKHNRAPMWETFEQSNTRQLSFVLNGERI